MPDHVEQKATFKTAKPGPFLIPELCLLNIKLLECKLALEVDLKTDDVPFVDLHEDGGKVKQTGSRPGAVLEDALGNRTFVSEQRVYYELDKQGEQADSVKEKWRECAFVFGHSLVVVDCHGKINVKNGKVKCQGDKEALRVLYDWSLFLEFADD